MSFCAASCFTSCRAAWFASATSGCSPTEDGGQRSNVAALGSVWRPAPSRPSHPACAVQPAPASCSLSNGLLAASSISIRARPNQGGALLTAHERLTAPGAVIHFPRCRARARKARLRSRYGHDPPEERLQSPLRTPLPPQPDSVPQDLSRL